MLKRLSNFGEQLVHQEIAGAILEYQGNIYRKIRMADVVDINCLSSRQLGSFALKAHFDFCVADDAHNPQFAIEYDGSGHDTRNDHLKDQIAREANLALFRIDEKLLNRTRGGLTFLQYLVHTYFLGQAFIEAQRSGVIAPDEPFMMGGFLKRDAKHIFDSDFEFVLPVYARLNRLFARNGYEQPPMGYHINASHTMLWKDDSSFIGFASLPVKSGFIFGRARLQIGTPSLGALDEVPFGVVALSDYCEGMIFENLYDEAEVYFASGGHTLRTRQDIKDEVSYLMSLGYRRLRAGCGADRELMEYGSYK